MTSSAFMVLARVIERFSPSPSETDAPPLARSGRGEAPPAHSPGSALRGTPVGGRDDVDHPRHAEPVDEGAEAG